MKSLKEMLGFFNRFIKNLDKYIKYQVITKLILTIIVVPLYGYLTSYLVDKSGKCLFTNGDIIKFLLSPQGFLFALFLFIVIMIEVIIEIGGYVLLSSRIRGGYTESSYIEILKYNIESIPKLFSVGGVLLVLYLGIMTPLTGFGIRLSFFKGLTVPNFVLEYIDQSTLYSIIYLIVLILLLYLGVRFIFTFNFMITYKMPPLRAIISSGKLVSSNKIKILKTLALIFIITFVLSFVFVFIWVFFIEWLSNYLNLNRTTQRVFIIFLLQLQTFGIIGVSFLSSPFRCYCITELFYDIIKETSLENILKKKDFDYIQKNNFPIYPDIKEKCKKSLIDKIFAYKKILSILIILFLFIYSSVVSVFTKEILGYNKNIEIFGHRGYGFYAPENSLSAFKKAIKENLDYIEIDVQRTKDRHYVLNHDKTFKRVSRNHPSFINKKVYELNLNQIKQLNIGAGFGDKYKNEKVPTIEQVLDLCKNNIKINLELKENVDKKMIDDIMKMIESRFMKKQVILTSLNANILRYIENKDPSFQTGLIYYIKLGNYKNYDVDYMIMEESQATRKNIQKLHNMGKKVIVWTVNSSDLIDKYSRMPIDGIITDYPKEVKAIFKENKDIGVHDLVLAAFAESLNEWLDNIK